MMKLVVCLAAAAAVLAGLVSLHEVRSGREVTGVMNPLQMMVTKKSLPSDRPIDRSVVFEQAPETGNER
jgi:hypothetical protein